MDASWVIRAHAASRADTGTRRLDRFDDDALEEDGGNAHKIAVLDEGGGAIGTMGYRLSSHGFGCSSP